MPISISDIGSWLPSVALDFLAPEIGIPLQLGSFAFGSGNVAQDLLNVPNVVGSWVAPKTSSNLYNVDDDVDDDFPDSEPYYAPAPVQDKEIAKFQASILSGRKAYLARRAKEEELEATNTYNYEDDAVVDEGLTDYVSEEPEATDTYNYEDDTFVEEVGQSVVGLPKYQSPKELAVGARASSEELARRAMGTVEHGVNPAYERRNNPNSNDFAIAKARYGAGWDDLQAGQRFARAVEVARNG